LVRPGGAQLHLHATVDSTVSWSWSCPRPSRAKGALINCLFSAYESNLWEITINSSNIEWQFVSSFFVENILKKSLFLSHAEFMELKPLNFLLLLLL